MYTFCVTDQGSANFFCQGEVTHTIPQRNILSCLSFPCTSYYRQLQNFSSTPTPRIANCLQGNTALECSLKYNASRMEIIISFVNRVAPPKPNSSTCLTFPRHVSTPALLCFSSGNSHCFPSTVHLPSSCWTLTLHDPGPRHHFSAMPPCIHPTLCSSNLRRTFVPLHASVLHSFMVCAHIDLPHWNVSSMKAIHLRQY